LHAYAYLPFCAGDAWVDTQEQPGPRTLTAEPDITVDVMDPMLMDKSVVYLLATDGVWTRFNKYE
jgi:hypothetical protein